MGVRCVSDPLGCAASTVTHAALGGIFTSLTSWVVASVSWLLDALGHVLAATGRPADVVAAAIPEYHVLSSLAPLVLLIGLGVATLQGIAHADVAGLWRVYLGVAPAAVAAVVLGPRLASIILVAVDQLAGAAAGSAVHRVPELAAIVQVAAVATPGFGAFTLAIVLTVGAWLLWCELVVRSIILTLLIVVVPLVVPLVTIPALRRLGWRLLETFAAVALSKVVIVIALVVGLDDLHGSSALTVVAGAVTLLLATASPFVVLRLIPWMEQSALHATEGLRQRATRAAAALPSSPVVAAARALAPEEPFGPPPSRGPDFGIPEWPSEGDVPLPEQPETRTPFPLGPSQPRHGHRVVLHDDMGPVIGWHWDD